jgi:Na+-driven multidrug efflux pump
LCAHTIAYNLVPLCFMIPLGISIGLTVRIGSIISSKSADVNKAKQLAIYTMIIAIIVGTIVVLLLWIFKWSIIRSFTTDPEVVEQSQSIWPMVCWHIWILNIFGINGGILKGDLSSGIFFFFELVLINLFSVFAL